LISRGLFEKLRFGATIEKIWLKEVWRGKMVESPGLYVNFQRLYSEA
jgi:hypothetical protein